MAERLTVAEDVEGSSPFSHPIHTTTLIVMTNSMKMVLEVTAIRVVVLYLNFIKKHRIVAKRSSICIY